MSASLDTDEPPPAKSDNALIAMKGFCGWKQTRETAAVSISMAVALNLEYKNSRYALLSTNTFALIPLSTLVTMGVLGKQVEFAHPSSFVPWIEKKV